MSKTLAIVIVIVLIIGAGAGYFLLRSKSPQAVPGGGSNLPPSSPEGSTPSQNLYTGFMKINPGAWVEVVVQQPNSGEQIHQKVVYAGEAKISGKDAQGMEFSITIQGVKSVAQGWIEKGTYKPVKYVAKMNGQVFCIDQSSIESYLPKETKPSLETPDEYEPTKPDISYGTYTTPTGKTVHVAKFKSEEGGEVWVSSEVPFGFVKTIDEEGNTVLSLYDFALSGGKIEITNEEVENCISIPNIPNIPSFK